MNDDVFARLLAPVAPETFFAEHFERQPLHVARNDAAYFADVYGVEDVEDALLIGADRREQFTLVKDGIALEAAIDVPTVLAQFDCGHTLVISDATCFSPRLQTIANCIAVRLGGFAVANVYFTPAGGRGFDVHYDHHGTIVLQIAGHKRWRLYEPLTDLPIDQRRFTAEEATQLRAIGEVALAPGDTLYVPQGVPHEAHAGERSLHVTLALRPVRVADVLRAAVDAAVEDDVALRRAWLPDAPLPDAAFREAFTVDRLARGAARARARAPARARFAPRGAFALLAALDALAPQTRLRLRAGVPLDVAIGSTQVTLTLGERSYALPPACGPLLQRLRTGLTFDDVQRALGAEAAGFVRLLALSAVLVEDCE